MDIDRRGAGWVRLSGAAPAGNTRIRILYRAGLAANWDAILAEAKFSSRTTSSR